jgi:hypothetical protein
MSDQDAGDEASRDQIADLEAFEARFPPKAFAGVARALGLPRDPRELSSLRCSLIEPFRFFYEGCGEEPTRAERVAGLCKLRDAARILLRLDPVDGDAWAGLTRQTYRASWDAQFRATLQRVAKEADEGLQRHRGRPGRPRKDAFRQLCADLIRVYEHFTGQEADRPNWLGGDKYRGAFYEFAVAVEQCLRAGFSEGKREVLKQLPVSVGAVGDGLWKHWTKIRQAAEEKPTL